LPCIKCSNGKYKYGERGRCQFDTLEDCVRAAAAIAIEERKLVPANAPVKQKVVDNPKPD